jgi:(2Fe-2S) ferredoxin
MSKFHAKQVSAFSLEAKFLGFEFEDGYKRKYLRLENSEGEYCIKLAKYLRSSLALDLRQGEWVQIFGEKKFNPKKDTLKLTAERVILVNNRQPQIPVPPTTKSKPAKASILICQKSDCIKRGSKGVCQALQAALGDHGLENEVEIKATGCLKQCKAGPNLVVMPDKTRYSRVQAEEIPELIDKHFQNEQQALPRELAVANMNNLATGK